MQRLLVEKRIRETHSRLLRVRKELAVLEEQLAVVADEEEDARIRSVVSETPLASHEHAEVKRHLVAMERARDELVSRMDTLTEKRDELVMSIGAQR